MFVEIGDTEAEICGTTDGLEASRNVDGIDKDTLGVGEERRSEESFVDAFLSPMVHHGARTNVGGHHGIHDSGTGRIFELQVKLTIVAKRKRTGPS